MIKLSVTILILAHFLMGCATKTKAPIATPAPAVSKAEPVKKIESEKKGTVCVNGVDSRTIEVVKANVCEVYYTKFADRQSIASSSHSMAHCEDVAKRIQSNLEVGGFSCKN